MRAAMFDILQWIEVARSRCRSLPHRWLGARIGRKVSLGKRVEILRPRGVQIGQRVTMESDVWLKLVTPEARLTIGEYTFVGKGVEMDVSERIEIGNHVLIAPSVFITDHNHNIAADQWIDQQGCTSSPVRIEDDVWLGARVVVLPGVTVGKGAVVGAGAVVNKNLPEYSISVGVPARVIRMRSSDSGRSA
jgi:acetyltransferase-like isoleucine patch superfamily enzyme